MELHEIVKSIDSKESLADFIDMLNKDFIERNNEWENISMEKFLLAMSAWMRDMDGFYVNTGRVLDKPDWKTFGEILLAAKAYE